MKAWITWPFLVIIACIVLLAVLALKVIAADFATYPEVSFIEGNLNPILLCAFAVLLWLWAAVKAWRTPDWPWLGSLLFALSWLVFPLLKLVNLYWINWSADTFLEHVDGLIWGGRSLAAYVRYEDYPWLADVLAACYFAFYFIVLAGVAVYTWRRHSTAAKAFFNGLMFVYLLGFIGYFALPAAGPVFYHLPDQGGGGVVARFVIETVKQGVTGMDVFPSLHTAITVFIVAFFYLDGYRKTAWCLLPVMLGLIAATIFLRYHYGVDVLAGLLLAAVALWWFSPKRLLD
ncbi:phosphatase PAP2 family protein [Suttonella sp. R2A3]|uniref:phosphatase PAP2 family protein n=1 Tax=Suttonella sp. R2A3 TaxID=2908648 RepID=UPI001F201B13|nr:phosphatase PAP2 family protein [Suttonella sp. R2A3]UJF25269.1 phosphatase PAP2 family protein [Suttonella sp. R2A3]